MRFVLLTALLSLAAAADASIPVQGDAAACRPGSGRDAILLTIDGFKNREGNVRVELWPGNERDFLRNHHELVAEGKAYHRVEIAPPASGPAKVCVPLPGPGTYAVGAFHSPAGVRKFNFRQDGASFTRNPRIGISRPKAAEVAVEYGPGLSEQLVVLNYLRGLSMRPIRPEKIQSAEQK